MKLIFIKSKAITINNQVGSHYMFKEAYTNKLTGFTMVGKLDGPQLKYICENGYRNHKGEFKLLN